MAWTRLCTKANRWEAELLAQLLAGYGIPIRLLDLGSTVYFGSGATTAVLVEKRNAYVASQLIEEQSSTS
ncbi:MAG: hypothetical protein AAF974_13440 [Cyanobacteria bacterium P01_E01_bin.34]